MSSSIDLDGLANLVIVVDNNIRPEEIYAFVKSHTDTFDPPLKVEIDKFDGEMIFFTALQSIIDDEDIPIDTRKLADEMYQSEHVRNW